MVTLRFAPRLLAEELISRSDAIEVRRRTLRACNALVDGVPADTHRRRCEYLVKVYMINHLQSFIDDGRADTTIIIPRGSR